MFHIASTLIALYSFWLLLSGFFTPFLMLSGFGSVLAVLWLSHRMDVVDGEGHPSHLGLRTLSYWPWLVKEIIKSGWAVSCLIVDPRLPISPTLVRFRPSQLTAVGLVTHANSITLTPGTIAVEVSADEFLVHGLTREGAEGCVDSEMDARVRRFEETA